MNYGTHPFLVDFDLLKSVERNIWVNICKQLSPASSEPLSSHEIAVPKNPKIYRKISKGSKRFQKIAYHSIAQKANTQYTPQESKNWKSSIRAG